MTSSTAASACSWVSFSFLTRRPNCPAVTLRASVRPASTNSCLTSLRTTSIPAAAMVWAIWPPMVPAPTTAALNTNMPRTLLLARGFAIRGALTGEARQGAGQRLALARADEHGVHQEGQGPEPLLLELVAQPEGHAHPVVAGGGERDRLGAGHGRVLDVGDLL